MSKVDVCQESDLPKKTKKRRRKQSNQSIPCCSQEFLHKCINLHLPIICITGPPRCGKSTIAKKLANYGNFYYFSARRISRHDMPAQKPRGARLGKILANLVVDISTRGIKGFIIDAFPVSLLELTAFQKYFCAPTVIVYLKQNLSQIMQREKLTRRDRRGDEIAVEYEHWNKGLEKLCNKHSEICIQIASHGNLEGVCEMVLLKLERQFHINFENMFYDPELNQTMVKHLCPSNIIEWESVV